MEASEQSSQPREAAARRALRVLLQPLAIDVRSLAAFRIGVATMLLVDLACRAVDLVDHYTDRGVFPRAARLALEHGEIFEGETRYEWSLHMLSGEPWAQAVLFLTATVFAAGMLVGYRTRLCTAASWLLLVSLHVRNPVLIDAGDTLLRAVMFWSMFVPLGAAASVDRRRRPGAGKPRRELLSIGGAALLLQIAMMYWCTAAAKNHPTWHQEYSAVYYALSIDGLTTPFGQSLLHFPTLLRILTIITYWLEWLGPCVALCPGLTRWPRAFTVFAFWILHTGMTLTLEVGVLEWIVNAVWLVYLPGVFWDALGRRAVCRRLAAWSESSLARRIVATLDRTVFRRPARADFRLSRWGAAFVTVCLLYVAGWNVHETFASVKAAVHLPKGWRIPGRAMGLAQWWFMFAPSPMTCDGWFVMKGFLEDGSVVNLWAPDEPLPLTKPASVAETYRNQRWRRFLMYMWEPYYADSLRDLAHWLQRRWDERYSQGRPGRKVKSVEIMYYIEETLPPGSVSPLITPMILWKSEYEEFVPPNPGS
ncbi:MAG TPA: HTTM domain-containing protein [Pirellulales bacterium]|nr:HTTM domain-containing protein [Pirellulales bacterium]